MTTSKIIPCKHKDKKVRLLVKYQGKAQIISACNYCYSVIESSSTCEILKIMRLDKDEKSKPITTHPKKHQRRDYFPTHRHLNEKQRLIRNAKYGFCDHPQKYWKIRIENHYLIRYCGICNKKLPIIKPK